jgi:hypothetical protein
VLGVVAFREKVPASPLLIALQIAGLIALVAGVILVARSPVLASLRQYHGPGEVLLHPETLLHRENLLHREHLHRQERRRHRDRQRRPSADPDDSSGAARPGLAGTRPADTSPAGSSPAANGAVGGNSGLPDTPARPGQAGSELGDAPASLRR